MPRETYDLATHISLRDTCNIHGQIAGQARMESGYKRGIIAQLGLELGVRCGGCLFGGFLFGVVNFWFHVMRVAALLPSSLLCFVSLHTCIVPGLHRSGSAQCRFASFYLFSFRSVRLFQSRFFFDHQFPI